MLSLIDQSKVKSQFFTNRLIFFYKAVKTIFLELSLSSQLINFITYRSKFFFSIAEKSDNFYKNDKLRLHIITSS